MDKSVISFIECMKRKFDFNRVKFVILFGSHAKGTSNKMSDYDFAVYYEGNNKQRFLFKKKMNGTKKFDVHVFQDMPSYIQKEVIQGKLIYAKDISFVYDVFYEVIKKFEFFKKYYYDYIKMKEII